ncbi:MAG: heavy metal sensor histidine kinase [Vicinamibacterales bacterium]
MNRGRTRSWSIVRRLTVWYAGSAFGLIVLATSVLYGALVSNLDREDDQFLSDIIHIVRAFLRDRPDDAAGLKQAVEWEWASRQYAQVFVRILDQNSKALVETPGMSTMLPPALFPSRVPVDREPAPGIEVETAEGLSFRALTADARVGSSGDDTRTIHVALNQAHELKLLADYRRRLGGVLSIAFVLCTIVGHAIARRAVRPVQEIAAAAKRVRSSTLGSRIDTATLPSEVAALADTFNTMLQGLQESFDRLSQFSADIAHELRTPVNNLRGEAEVALSKLRSPHEYQETLGSLLEESQRLSRIIDGLLFMARAETPDIHIVRETLSVAQELSVVRDFYEPAATEAGVTLSVSATADLQVDVDRTLFQRAVGNLVSNALTHTPSGGQARIEAVQDHRALQVAVRDTGRGITPEHLPHVFDRFYRVDRSRSTTSGGLGLGLPLVKSIMRLHQGSVDIESQPGSGTSVYLRFPRVSLSDAPPDHHV